MSKHRPKVAPPPPRPAWTPFERAQELSAEMGGGRMYMNSLYTVIVAPHQGMIHLSIRNNDRSARHDWREFQRIKNELVGSEHDGYEVYPAESRLLDTANQFHLWVFASPSSRVAFGFDERLVAYESSGATKAQQRVIPPEERPPDALSGEEMDRMTAALTRKQENA